MQYPPELLILTLTCLMTVVMWLPYVAARALTVGVSAALGNPSPAFASVAPWALRARQAHANAVENLVVFAPLVLTAAFLNVSNSATLLAAKIYLAARVVHYVVYTAGIPVLRTLAFLAGFVSTLTFAIEIFSAYA